MNTVVHILDALDAAPGGHTDALLLDRFVRFRDDEAFAALVRRYGPMVLGVCRRVLRHTADADDAFQAAFLVLARKAAVTDARASLGPWLHGVAYNTARKLQRTRARRANHERPLATATESHAPEADGRAELLAILDEELKQLPERYRAVVVLCDLEGLTRRAAAQRLACPEGTVAGRLARARDLLAARLVRRGVGTVAGLFVALLGTRAPALGPDRIANLVRAARVDDLARAAAQGLISARAAATTEGVLKSMLATKLRTAATAALCCGVALALGAGAWHSANAQPDPRQYVPPADKPSERPVKPAAPADTGKKQLYLISLKKLDAKATAEKVLKLLPESVTVAAARDENVLLVYATEKGGDDLRLVLRTLGEDVSKEEAAPPAKQQKRIAIPFEKIGWPEALEWYAKESGLTLVTAVQPTGSLIIKSNKDRKYTLAEVTDLFNEALTQQKFILIRRHQTFFIQPADERIDPTLIPRIEVAELADRGKTEIVQVLLPVKGVAAEDVQDELKKCLTPFGSLVSVKPNFILIQDTAGNIVRIRELINPQRLDEPVETDSLEHVCVWRAAKEIAKSLESLLADEKTKVVVGAPENKPNAPDARIKTVQITVNTNRNSVLVTAPPDKIGLAKQLIKTLDTKPTPDAKRYTTPTPVAKSYDVPAGSAADLAKTLQARFPQAQIVPLLERNQLLVVASPADHKEMTAQGFEGYGRPNPLALPLPGLTEKTYSFKFEKAPWKDVFVWYATTTGLTQTGDRLPEGTFTFAPPKPDRTYTLAETTDLINDALLAHKWLLIRGEKSFRIHPADERVDPSLVPQVEIADLAKRGRTELVRIRLTIAGASGEEIAGAVRKLVGPFGDATWFPNGRGLLIRDTAGNLLPIVKALRALEDSADLKKLNEK